jgi:phosphomannomutase/phosphoglucomutase
MVLITGLGTVLISKTVVAKSKVDAVSAVAKGVALALSEQVNLLNSVLDKMAQDPDVINAAAQNNPELLASAVKKLENHLPGVLSIKFLLPESADPTKKNAVDMSFADLEMARQTFTQNQQTAIQGDGTDRHLAIARRIMQNNTAVGVMLAGLNYDFVDRILASTKLDNGYIELRQGKLALASSGEKKDHKEMDDNDPIAVPNTNWELYYDNKSASSLIEFSLIVGVILIPALMVALGFVTGYRKISDLLTDDMSWVMKAFKDILTEKPLGEYPVKLSEISVVISTLAQFKRVVNDKWFEI